MIHLDYARTYSKLSIEALSALNKDRATMAEAALVELDIELKARSLSAADLAAISSRAYEALGGIVVTRRSIRIPKLCPRCLDTKPDVSRPVASLDAEYRCRLFYTKTITHIYSFLFCRPCAAGLHANSGLGCGVVISRLPTTKFDLFTFAHGEYQDLFLRVNR